MRIRRLPFLSGSILFLWGVLYLINTLMGFWGGAATIFLPVSISLLLIRELRVKRPPFDLSIIFLASCLFFFCISTILWPFSSFPPTEFLSLVIASFTLNQLDHASILIGVSISITMLTLTICRESANLRTPKVFIPNQSVHSPDLYRFGAVLMVLALPAVAYESWQQLQYVRDVGYLALYTDGVPTSVWATYCFYFYYFGFRLTFTFAKSRAEFLMPAFLYLAVATLDSLKGARGAVMVPLIFVIWFYLSRFNVKIRMVAAVRSLLIIAGLFMALTYQRDASLLDTGIAQFVVDALSTQGRSLQLTVLYQEVADEVARYGNNMVFSNLQIPFVSILHPEIRDAAQSMDHVLYSNNLKHILTFVLNQSYYLLGGGTGGVYIIELIEAGFVMYVLLSVGLGWFLAWLPGAMRGPCVRHLSIYFLTTIFYLPRGEFFFNSLIVGKALILYFLVTRGYNVLRNRRANSSIRTAQAEPSLATTGKK